MLAWKYLLPPILEQRHHEHIIKLINLSTIV